MKRLLFLLVALIVAGHTQNLVINGDFEQELTEGWVFYGEGTGTHLADRSTGYDPDPDYEAHTYQYDNPGFARLSQTVAVPNPLLSLSFWAKFEEAGGSSTCWPAACVEVCYLDANNVKLGTTRYYYSTYANWVANETLSLIRITNPDWRQYTLDIAQELTQNLPGVNQGDIARIQFALYSITTSG